MRLHPIYLFFASLFITSVLATGSSTPNIIKGSVYAVEVTGDIIYLFEGESNSKILNIGDEISIKSLIEFKNIRDNCNLQLFFSNRMNIFFHTKGWFTIENFEHFIDKDENGNPVNGGEIINMYVRGKVDFKQESVKEEGYISVNTGFADLEIKSKDFYVDSSNYSTIVECYDGKIIMTNSMTLKSTILEAGNYAEIFSSGGEKNTSIEIHSLTPDKLKARHTRIGNLQIIEWKFLTINDLRKKT